MSELASSVEHLEGVVRQACATQDEWPARVAAGIRAMLELVVRDPKTARALTLKGPDGEHLPSVIERFAGMLAAETRPPGRLPSPTERALVGGIACVVANHVRAGRLEQLRGQAPDLIYFALVPYLGFDGAKKWL